MANLKVDSFFDPTSNTYSYLVADAATGEAAIIDPVLDFDPAAGSIGHEPAERLIDCVRARDLRVAWILETHIHADHLSAAAYLRERLGGRLGIGRGVAQVQQTFGQCFNAESSFARDGSQWDALFADGEQVALGEQRFHIMETPGHTPACVTYVFDGCAFVGDTIFMPDLGTARCDFPGGDARTLYRSIQRILALPDATRLYLCHDYGASGRRECCNVTSVAHERAANTFVRTGTCEESFVAAREQRDRGLRVPALLYPAVQFNMRAGAYPPPEDNGESYFKIPLSIG
ncbi:MAG: MBL fold metallo-hydrolase [Pseudomonadota bacterium]